MPDDPSTNSAFGWSVSICDDYAIIGAPRNGKPYNYGSAYIFKRNDSNWAQQAMLSASDSYELNYFGKKVAISGNYSIIRASNSAYFFYYDGNRWSEHSKIATENLPAVDIFQKYEIIATMHNAIIYELKNNIWEKVTTIYTSNRYGYIDHVSVFDNYAIIGKTAASFNGKDSGAALIYKRIDGNWKRQTTIIASDGYEEDHYGTAVSISQNHFIVGAPYKDHNSIRDVGAVYIYPIDTINPVISGYVRGLNDIPLSDASISFDKLSSPIKTNAKGYFEKDVCYNWSGRATVSFENYIFEPDFIAFSTVTNNIQNQNYKVPTSTITGFEILSDQVN